MKHKIHKNIGNASTDELQIIHCDSIYYLGAVRFKNGEYMCTLNRGGVDVFVEDVSSFVEGRSKILEKFNEFMQVDTDAQKSRDLTNLINSYASQIL